MTYIDDYVARAKYRALPWWRKTLHWLAFIVVLGIIGISLGS